MSKSVENRLEELTETMRVLQAEHQVLMAKTIALQISVKVLLLESQIAGKSPGGTYKKFKQDLKAAFNEDAINLDPFLKQAVLEYIDDLFPEDTIMGFY